MRRDYTILAWVTGLVVLVLVYGTFVWPTPYAIHFMPGGGFRWYVQVNRFTGNARMVPFQMESSEATTTEEK